jgi:hypothetical protein
VAESLVHELDDRRARHASRSAVIAMRVHEGRLTVAAAARVLVTGFLPVRSLAFKQPFEYMRTPPEIQVIL